MKIRRTCYTFALMALLSSCNKPKETVPPSAVGSAPADQTAVAVASLCYTNFITQDFQNYSGAEWQQAVRQAQQDGRIQKEMTLSDLSRILGEPSRKEELYWEWYFLSPKHINPAFVVYHTNGVAAEFKWNVK